uniref:Uncharacterized protein n=1 Tax=Oryza sativa subsp. japonica TaxID=39947 RepID=Q84YN6_ORYSJ|nr:hypothetical protein [Oryza sativa Japonica Group]BAD31189.1 hypothetical protein [Oryza sativa Japonica Group]
MDGLEVALSWVDEHGGEPPLHLPWAAREYIPALAAAGRMDRRMETERRRFLDTIVDLI